MCDTATMSIDQSIARIRQFAADRGLRRARLAREAGLHPNTLRGFHDPEWNPQIETIRKLEAYVDEQAAVAGAEVDTPSAPAGSEAAA